MPNKSCYAYGGLSLEKGLWLGGDPVTAWDTVSTSKYPGPHSVMRSAAEVSLLSSGLTARLEAVLQNSVMMLAFSTSTAED